MPLTCARFSARRAFLVNGMYPFRTSTACRTGSTSCSHSRIILSSESSGLCCSTRCTVPRGVSYTCNAGGMVLERDSNMRSLWLDTRVYVRE